MNNQLILKKCQNCGAIIKELKACTCSDCGIKCCQEVMTTLMPNKVDAAYEKHIPTIEISGEYINVSVNHVMDEDHYIEWIAMITNNEEHFIYFKPGDVAKTTFKYVPNAKIYAFCNKHDLWEKTVEE